MKKHFLILLALLLGIALAVPAQVSDPPVDHVSIALGVPSVDGLEVALAGTPTHPAFAPVQVGSFGFLPIWTSPVSIVRSFGGSAGVPSDQHSMGLRLPVEPRSIPGSDGPVGVSTGSSVAMRAQPRSRPLVISGVVSTVTSPCSGLHRPDRGSI